MTLTATEQDCAAVAKAPRIALSDIEGAVIRRFFFTGDQAALAFDSTTLLHGFTQDVATLQVLTICILVMRNGFTVIGKSAPAAPENFNPELGCKLAYEDAVRQMWPLMGYALRERLFSEATVKEPPEGDA
jgi:hypothetical protein